MKAFKIITLLVAMSISFSSCKKEGKKVVKDLKIEFKKEGDLTIRNNMTDSIVAVFDIEIADDEYQRQTGLMHRESMQDNQAMLFIFDDVDFRSFYMKDTYIPLDIIFLDAEGKLTSVQYDAQPMDETSLPSSAPSKYVLEVNAGITKKLDLRIGDYIQYTLSN